MITRIEREKLFSKYRLPEGGIGWDCDGQIIKSGDMVEVLVEEENRRGRPEYDFCSIGKIGQALISLGALSWTITVKFGDNVVGCADISLKKL